VLIRITTVLEDVDDNFIRYVTYRNISSRITTVLEDVDDNFIRYVTYRNI